FERLWCPDEAKAAGLAFTPRQFSLSTNVRARTLRGLHWQAEPYGEAKLVSAASGCLFDVAVDIRADSPSFRQWFGIELAAGSGVSLFIPPGFAHGFLTLAPDTGVVYAIDASYRADAARGVRYDDPAFAIPWPTEPDVISDRDLAFAPFH
ncbi:MAG: dTDP-4-keto-6-deoxy-D-glucose epimerase, partial [Sphingomonadales bacterium]